MQISTKELYDVLTAFERDYKHLRLDLEDDGMWDNGYIYQDGETNKLYRAYRQGYTLGRLKYMREGDEQ